ncbi:DUF6266 family protein [Pedobacter sp. P351]|uniref:DUF6266 family protein n=1 Tax=Pedobacter superstes TaxID=3133441 RepID=UPI0030981ABC
MAILVNNVLGSFRGKVGDIIGYWSKQGYRIRKAPAKSLKEATEAQKTQRAKFALTSCFLNPLRELLHLLPERGKKKQTAFNSAFSRVSKEAVYGSGDGCFIRFEAVKLSSGNMRTGYMHALSVCGWRINLSWCHHHPVTYGTAVLLVYNSVKKCWVYTLSAQSESGNSVHLDVPCDFSGDKLEIYFFLIAASRKDVSDTVYLGSRSIDEEGC